MEKEENKIKGGATIWARQTMESDIFYWKPDKWFKIWFYLVNAVNHTDTRLFAIGSNFITYKKISEYTKATKNQIHEFFRWAKEHEMLTTRKTTRGMVVTIDKYKFFQDLDNYINHTENQIKTTHKPHYKQECKNKDTSTEERIQEKTPADFITQIKENPAYTSIDVDRELFKMDAWLLTPKGRGRKKTKAFILNWLNKIDVPVITKKGINATVHPVPNKPKEMTPEEELRTIFGEYYETTKEVHKTVPEQFYIRSLKEIENE